MAEKRDWLGTCNDKAVPLEDFQLQFCARCLTPDCTRSQHGQSRFDARVGNWEDRLFHSVPRMDSSDPRFGQIQAKRFLGIDTGRPHEVQSWVDPRELEEATTPPLPPKPAPVPEPVPIPEPVPEYEVPRTTQVQAETLADLDEQGPAEVDIQEAIAVQETPAVPRQTAPMNTPIEPRQMVGGKKVDERVTVSVSDPWKAPKPDKAPDGLKVVPSGAKIRLGGGSGV